MDDRVGDILAHRARLENGVGTAIFFSILFHATLAAIAGWLAWHHTSTPVASLMTIRLAQAQPVAEMTPAQPAPVPQPVAEEQPKPKPKIVEKTAPPSPFGKSKRKPAEEPPPATRTPPPAASALEVPIGGAGVTALEGGDFPYTLYIERMKTLIGSHWLRPQVDNIEAIVYFAIDRDGSIRDAKVEAASGNGLYDRAALRAVLESSPLPPLPFGYNGTYLGVHLKFR
jgi:periplasmic protein TonB